MKFLRSLNRDVLMPELPEVEISRRGIEPWLTGNIILRTEVRNTRLRWSVDKKIIALCYQRVLSVQRRAKYLLLELEKGWIIIHLGMSGRIQVLVHPSAPGKHDHIDLLMSNGCIIRYTDPRRFGYWVWIKELKNSLLLNNLGLEPLSEEFNGHWLYEKLRNKRSQIKSYLMNNKLVVGIGNIYASESLFIAGILPERTASSLNKAEATKLTSSIKSLLLCSIKQGGTTIKDFLQSDGKKGSFGKQLYVYGRDGKMCLVCDTPIKRTKYAQRSTFFCPNCQH